MEVNNKQEIKKSSNVIGIVYGSEEPDRWIFWKIYQNLCYDHRVSIEWKSPYKESYTVNSHWKSFDDVMDDICACVRFQN